MEIRDQVSEDSDAVFRLVEEAFGARAAAELIGARQNSGDTEISIASREL